MNNTIKTKAMAAAKMAMGTARMASALVTATGHGLIGAACRKHHMMTKAWYFARMGLAGGQRQFDEGVAEWNKANR